MKFRKIIASILAASTALSLAACSNGGSGTASSGADQSNTSSDAGSNTGNNSSDSTTTAGLTLKVLTHRTDRIEDGSLAEMTKAFEDANNCKVEYRASQTMQTTFQQ